MKAVKHSISERTDGFPFYERGKIVVAPAGTFICVLTALLIQTKSDQIAPRIYFYVHLLCRHLGKYTILLPTKENTRVADPVGSPFLKGSNLDFRQFK